MKALILFLATAISVSVHASDQRVVSCQKAKVGLASLIGPVGETTRYFKEGQVAVYTVDHFEPACCSAGVAVVIPNVDGPAGNMQRCFAILGYYGVDVKNARSSFNPVTGLLIEIDTREVGGSAGKPLQLRVNLKNSTVSLEKNAVP
jgi:hypothetical protein